jgi:hypothetical protein
MKGIRYNGRVGNPASNDHGQWETGEAKPIGEAYGQVSPGAAAGYVASGCFEYVEIDNDETALD